VKEVIRDQFGTVVDVVPPRPSFLVCADLGQSNDYTAVAVLERSQVRHEAEAVYRCRHLERYRGRSYVEVAASLRMLVTTLSQTQKVTLLIDRTGVGAGVVDVIEAAGVAGDLVSILIHGGDRVSRDGGIWRVPKRDLVGAIAVLLQGGRLKISPDLTLAPVLTTELQNFRLKFTPSGHDQYESWREDQHDDLCLAVSLGCWYGERGELTWDDVDGEDFVNFLHQAGVDLAW